MRLECNGRAPGREIVFSVATSDARASSGFEQQPKEDDDYGAPNLERRRLLLRGATSRVSNSRNKAGKKAKISSNAKKVH